MSNYSRTYKIRYSSKTGNAFRLPKKYALTLLLLTASLLNYFSQTNLQVVTTTIEKTFHVESSLSYRYKNKININAEKSNISITNWDKAEIKIVLKLTSKHPNKKTAEEELKYMRYLMEQNGNKIEIKNYFAMPNETQKINGSLKAEYEIFAPYKTNFSITNNYGNISIKNTDGLFTISNEYGNIVLQNIKGEMQVKTYFCDISGESLSGIFSIKSNHSDISLNKIQGNYNIDAIYGETSLWLAEKANRITINAQNSDVNIETDNFKQFNYKLFTSFGDIKLPEGNHYEVVTYSESEKSISYGNTNLMPLVNIKASFGRIAIK